MAKAKPAGAGSPDKGVKAAKPARPLSPGARIKAAAKVRHAELVRDTLARRAARDAD